MGSTRQRPARNRSWPQRPHDLALLDPLLDRTFGPDRQARTVYRLREGLAPVPELCFAAVDRHDRPLASLRFWPIRIAEIPAILLGGRALSWQGTNVRSRAPLFSTW